MWHDVKLSDVSFARTLIHSESSIFSKSNFNQIRGVLIKLECLPLLKHLTPPNVKSIECCRF